MVPFSVIFPQVPPVVVTVKLNGEPVVVVGVPLMVTTFPEIEELTPEGKPVTVTPVALPPKV